MANMAGRKWRRKYGENGGKNVYGITVWRLESIETRETDKKMDGWMDGWMEDEEEVDSVDIISRC